MVTVSLILCHVHYGMVTVSLILCHVHWHMIIVSQLLFQGYCYDNFFHGYCMSIVCQGC